MSPIGEESGGGGVESEVGKIEETDVIGVIIGGRRDGDLVVLED